MANRKELGEAALLRSWDFMTPLGKVIPASWAPTYLCLVRIEIRDVFVAIS